MEIERYIEEFSAAGTEADNALLTELERVTNLRAVQPKMVSGRAQGAFLTLITKMLRPKLVLEIGTFTGYSALAIAAGLDEPDGSERLAAGPERQAGPAMQTTRGSETQMPEIHTVEIDDELEELAQSFFDRSPHGRKIRLHIGSALDLVPQLFRRLGRPFDLVFIDGDKREYPDYYRMLMGDGGGEMMVRSGSIILTDNVLWYGKVAQPGTSEPEGARDRHTAGVAEFNKLIINDIRVENVILPLRDGINLIRVK